MHMHTHTHTHINEHTSDETYDKHNNFTIGGDACNLSTYILSGTLGA